ncbi:uncharacterized protein LOC120207535 [Hibiscus syriacus]|uniref:uncharacterized protein LOC120207535 n=1 Tax=Hibiscus syriacus TaxID=106335 RepID=UPI0019241E17|nr:uncharacterized protein LOC120207535 [Hibiscus syriacus]
MQCDHLCCKRNIRALITEVYYCDQISREKFKSLLEEKGFPIGLFAFQDIQECGYVKDSGFICLPKKKHDDEITAFFEPNKIKNLTGVKVKEYMIWITLTDIYVDQSSSITLKTNLVGVVPRVDF